MATAKPRSCQAGMRGVAQASSTRGAVPPVEHSAADRACPFGSPPGLLLALAAIIWRNWNIHAADKRSLVAYDH